VKFLGAIQRRVVTGLAVLSSAMLAAFTIGICYDVLVRSLGFQPPNYTVSLVEYGLLYVTVLSAPWLLREKGHVFVDMAVRAMPPRVRRANEIAMYALGLAICLILAYAAGDLTLESWQRGDLDTRDFDMPRWAIYLPMTLSFLLLAFEFVRYLCGADSLYRDTAGPSEQL
jgi:TRAP-type C4-dicarboxylate transport system permease small subunit